MDELALLLSRLRDWQTVLDLALVTLVFYGLLRLFQGTGAVQVFRGAVLLAIVVALTLNLVELSAFSWLVRAATPAILVAIPVVFQPELRRALERLGRGAVTLGRPTRLSQDAHTIEEIVQAVRTLSDRRHGALIVVEGETGLQEYRETGVPINGQVSARLLLTIFHPGTSLHDGAVFVRGNQILAAAALLPMTSRELPDPHLGTRHRAAIGITEESDALAIVVSEETGIVSVARSGRMVRRLDDTQLRKVLQAFSLRSL